MKKLFILSLTLLSFGIVFTSCSDDDDKKEDYVSPTKLLTEIKTEKGGTVQLVQLEYDNKDRLAKITTINTFHNTSNNDTSNSVMAYNAAGQIENITRSSNKSPDYSYDFRYNKDTVFVSHKKGVYTDTLIVNDKNQPIKSSTISEYNEKVIHKYEYDAAGNMISHFESHHKIGADYASTMLRKYTYDDRKGVLANISNAPWLFNNDAINLYLYFDNYTSVVNNPIRQEYVRQSINDNGKISYTDTSIATWTYTYGEDGFPSASTREDDLNGYVAQYITNFTYQQGEIRSAY